MDRADKRIVFPGKLIKKFSTFLLLDVGCFAIEF